MQIRVGWSHTVTVTIGALKFTRKCKTLSNSHHVGFFYAIYGPHMTFHGLILWTAPLTFQESMSNYRCMHLFLQSKGHVPSGNLTGQWAIARSDYQRAHALLIVEINAYTDMCIYIYRHYIYIYIIYIYTLYIYIYTHYIYIYIIYICAFMHIYIYI